MSIPQPPGTDRIPIPGQVPAPPMSAAPTSTVPDPRYAGAGDRFVGLLLGAVVQLVVLGIPIGLLAVSPLVGVISYVLLVPGFVITQWYLLATTGRTLDKRLAGLAVLDQQTFQPIGWGRAFKRQLALGAVSGLTLGIGLVVIARGIGTNPRKQGWHDRISGAVEVRLPLPRGLAQAATEVVPALPGMPAPAPGAPAQVVAPPPVTPVPPTPSSQPRIDPTGLIQAVPGLAIRPPEAKVPAPVGAGPSIDSSTRATPPTVAPQQAVLRLVLEDGRTVTLQGCVVVGRNPSPGPDDVDPQLVAVEDPAMSVSKTHAAFGGAPGSAWVEDRSSTNGVSVQRAGATTWIDPMVRTPLQVGDVVALGDRSFRVVG